MTTSATQKLKEILGTATVYTTAFAAVSIGGAVFLGVFLLSLDLFAALLGPVVPGVWGGIFIILLAFVPPVFLTAVLLAAIDRDA